MLVNHTGVPSTGDLCLCVARSHPRVYPPVHPTRHIHHLHPACRNVYDTLLNIVMARCVSMNLGLSYKKKKRRVPLGHVWGSLPAAQ